MLGASTLASWGTLGRSWDDPGAILGDIGGHKEGPCEVQAWILSIFWWFWGSILTVFWAFLDQKSRFFHIYFQVVFGFKFGCLGLEKHAFGMECIAKINFRRNWISCDSRVDFSWFWVALGSIFMAFVALETGLKIDDFSGFPGGTPEFRQCTSGTLKCFFLGAGKQHSYRYHPSVLRLKSSRR